jgi:hypothetical protein
MMLRPLPSRPTPRYRRLWAILTLITAPVWPLAVLGQEDAAGGPGPDIETSSGRGTAAEAAAAWEAFTPPPDSEFDWIQLTSDEWLKGELTALYNFTLEFDSDELGSLIFDWDDVRRVRTAGPRAVRVEDPGNGGEPRTVVGVLRIVDEMAYVGEEPDPLVFERDEIVAIAVGTEREIDRWSGDISLGVNFRQGNADLTDATLAASVERRRAVSRLGVDYLGNYSRVEGSETSNNHRVDGYYDRFASTRLFWRPVSGGYVRDPFRNIKHQATLGSGLGSQLTRTAKTEWNITAGVGVLYKEFVSVEPGRDRVNVSPALTLGTRYDTELRSWLDYLFDFSFQVVDKETGTYIHHLVTTLSSDLIGDLDLDVSLIWDRIQDPQPDADGLAPDRDDFQLIVAVSYEF